MVDFVERKFIGNIPTNKYYNDQTMVGKTGGYQIKGGKLECVNYAMGRTCEIAERKCVYYKKLNETIADCDNPIFDGGYENAKHWFANSKWPKTTNPNEVRCGDIVCYGSSWGNGYGHVRIVERIEGNYMFLSGGNEDGKGQIRFGIKCPISVGGGENATGLQGYIHNIHINVPKEEIDYKALYLEAKAKLEKIKGIL